MRGYWIRLAVPVLAVILIAVGCVPLSAPPAVSPFPIGTYTGTGSWTWELKADGTSISQSSTVDDLGTYVVTGDQIVLKGDYCGDVEGTYTWTFDGEVLRFTTVDDQCDDRRYVVASGKWSKQP